MELSADSHLIQNGIILCVNGMQIFGMMIGQLEETSYMHLSNIQNQLWMGGLFVCGDE